MEAQRIRIALHDDSPGFEVSPRRVRLRTLRAFVVDADELIRGGEGETDWRDLDVSVVSGSLAIDTFPTADPGLLHDLQVLARSSILDALQRGRRIVVERWQKSVRVNPGQRYVVSAPFLDRPIVVSPESDFRTDDADQWVRVERYVRGEIEDVGGRKQPNAHVRLPDGKTLVVATDRELLRADKVNRLYKPAMVRISAEYNVVTRQYRKARLIEFVEHSTTLDQSALKRLTDRGASAWAGVADATAWVEGLRGNDS